MAKRNQYNRPNFNQIPTLTFTAGMTMDGAMTIPLSASMNQSMPVLVDATAIIADSAVTGTQNSFGGVIQFSNITLDVDESFTFVLNNDRLLPSSPGAGGVASTLFTNTGRLSGTLTTLSASTTGQAKIRVTSLNGGIAGDTGFITYRIIGGKS